MYPTYQGPRTPPHTPERQVQQYPYGQGTVYTTTQGVGTGRVPWNFNGPTYMNVFGEPGRYTLHTHLSGNMQRPFGMGNNGSRYPNFAGQQGNVHFGIPGGRAQANLANNTPPRMPLVSTPHHSSKQFDMSSSSDDTKDKGKFYD